MAHFARSFVQFFIYLIMINMFRRVNLISLIENNPMKSITKLTLWMIKHLSAAAKITSPGVWTNVHPSDRKTYSEFTKKSIHIRSHRGRETLQKIRELSSRWRSQRHWKMEVSSSSGKKQGVWNNGDRGIFSFCDMKPGWDIWNDIELLLDSHHDNTQYNDAAQLMLHTFEKLPEVKHWGA